MRPNDAVKTVNVDANENELKDVKLSEGEINSVKGFDDLTLQEKGELLEFIYSLSLILFKSFKHDQS